MSGKKTGEPGEDQRLRSEARIMLLVRRTVGVARRARERIGEQLVHIDMQVVCVPRLGRLGLLPQECARMAKKAIVHPLFDAARALFFYLPAHGLFSP